MLLELTVEEAAACMAACGARAMEFEMLARDQEGNRLPMNAAQQERWRWWWAVADKIGSQIGAPNDQGDAPI